VISCQMSVVSPSTSLGMDRGTGDYSDESGDRMIEYVKTLSKAGKIPVRRLLKKDRRIAYFSMEIGINTGIRTYSGGLGILAGDTVKSCADLP
ncbi:MAG: hypothetical protein ABIJ27_00760, partial [Candidatus Omnitrophota bacterium]